MPPDITKTDKMRVSLFIACFNDTLFPSTGKAVVEVLERLGHEVDFPMEQTCCGQMHFNSGYQEGLAPLLRRFVNGFGSAEAVVCPSSSCVNMIRAHYPKLAKESGDAALAAAIEALVPRVFEFAEFLVRKLGVTDCGAYYPHRVTYHPTCSSLRALKVTEDAMALLKDVRGLDLVELPEATECCGFGGTFAVKNGDVSSAMLADKIACIQRTESEAVTALDNSCLMHMEGGLHRLRTGVRAIHLAEILASTEDQPPAQAGPMHPAGVSHG